MSLLASVTEDYLYGITAGAGVEDINSFAKLSDILIFAFNVAFGVGFAVTLLNLGLAFIMYTMSAGDPKAIKKAQNAVIWSGIGMGIIVGSWMFKKIVLNTMGVTEGIIVNDPNY